MGGRAQNSRGLAESRVLRPRHFLVFLYVKKPRANSCRQQLYLGRDLSFVLHANVGSSGFQW